MRLTKFLGRKCKVCMRILLLKSLFLGTNCPSFLPILCGILFSLCLYLSFSFFSLVCFSFSLVFCGILFSLCLYLSFFVYYHQSLLSVISYFLPCSFYYLPRNPKNVGVFLEKVHRFSENLHRFFENLHRFLGLLSNV